MFFILTTFSASFRSDRKFQVGIRMITIITTVRSQTFFVLRNDKKHSRNSKSHFWFWRFVGRIFRLFSLRRFHHHYSTTKIWSRREKNESNWPLKNIAMTILVSKWWKIAIISNLKWWKIVMTIWSLQLLSTVYGKNEIADWQRHQNRVSLCFVCELVSFLSRKQTKFTAKF